jgi:EAL domain
MVSTRTGSLPDCRPLLADPDDLTLVFQPIVDLAGATVAGYEALARFPGTAGPDVWFAAAAEAGLAAELQALLLHKAIARLVDLPPGTFLLVRGAAPLIGSGPVRAALASRPRLHGLALELDGPRHAPELASLRARGARTDVEVLARDSVEALAGAGVVASAARRGSLLLAEGLDGLDDLTAALRCGTLLGRGWLFGAPSTGFRSLASGVVDLVRTGSARVRLAVPVLGLVRPVRQVLFPSSDEPPAVEVGADGSAIALLLAGPSGSTWRRPVTLSVPPTAGTGETLRLALSRPAEHRYEPVLCHDEDGRPLGLIRVADLVRATAR